MLCVAAWLAEMDFDPSRGVPFDGFLYQRGMARAFTRYRQEWCYGMRFCSGRPDICLRGEEDPGELDYRPHVSGRVRVADEAISSKGSDSPLEELAEALAGLSEPNRRLIELLFWEERSECEIAKEFGISQPAICKRKQTVLRALQRRVVGQK